jgi:hypothetical protein
MASRYLRKRSQEVCFGVIEFGGAAGLFAEDVVYVSEGLFEDGSYLL